MVPSSRIYQLKSRPGSLKDRKLKNEYSEMYKMTCPNCEKCYIGQLKRLSVCWGEHEGEAEMARRKNKKSTTLKSMIGRHMIEERHIITWDSVEVIEECGDSRKLYAQESLAILREPEGNRLNHETDNVQSKLLREVARAG